MAAVWVSAPSDRLHISAHAGISQPAIAETAEWEASLYPTACRTSTQHIRNLTDVMNDAESGGWEAVCRASMHDLFAAFVM